MTAARNQLAIGEKSSNWGKRGAETSQWGKREEKSSSWKGGRRKNLSGYIMIKNRDHHRAQGNGYVLEHILVMEEMLGRPLTDGETVHHCNGDKAENRPYNLRLFASQGEHISFHFKLLRDGITEVGYRGRALYSCAEFVICAISGRLHCKECTHSRVEKEGKK